MAEYLDIVNNSDEVIGKVLRKDAHEKQILHRIILIFCFKNESENEILIQKRSSCCDVAPLKLSVPGGHVNSGETYESAAIREFLEEENGKSDLIEWFKFKSFTDGSPKFTTVFKTFNEGPFINQENEVSKSFFMKIDELKEELKQNPNEYTEIMVESFKHII
jgi:ADP-ribose pyrophosphatase YjhB (NUDIX family)